MKKELFFGLSILSLVFLMACGGSGSQPTSTEEVTETTTTDTVSQTLATEHAPPAFPANKNPDGIGGYYVGDFEATEMKDNKRPSYFNKITVSIDSIANNMLYGHSIVAGNIRPFSGTYRTEKTNYMVEGKEPGDDKYDGSFSFTLSTENKTIIGTWAANGKQLAVTKRKYELKKKEFKYDPNLELGDDVTLQELYATSGLPDNADYEAISGDVMKVNASKSLLKKEDIENMYQGDLEVIRNAIYARHGYSFKNRKMRYVFDSAVEWYMPLYTDVRNMLTSIERKNEDLLKRYEEHAAKYYDVYGR